MARTPLWRSKSLTAAERCFPSPCRSLQRLVVEAALGLFRFRVLRLPQLLGFFGAVFGVGMYSATKLFPNMFAAPVTGKK